MENISGHTICCPNCGAETQYAICEYCGACTIPNDIGKSDDYSYKDLKEEIAELLSPNSDVFALLIRGIDNRFSVFDTNLDYRNGISICLPEAFINWDFIDWNYEDWAGVSSNNNRSAFLRLCFDCDKRGYDQFGTYDYVRRAYERFKETTYYRLFKRYHDANGWEYYVLYLGDNAYTAACAATRILYNLEEEYMKVELISINECFYITEEHNDNQDNEKMSFGEFLALTSDWETFFIDNDDWLRMTRSQRILYVTMIVFLGAMVLFSIIAIIGCALT